MKIGHVPASQWAKWRPVSYWPSLARLLHPSLNSCWHSRCGEGQWVTGLQILGGLKTSAWRGGEERRRRLTQRRGGKRCEGGGYGRGEDRGGAQAWFRTGILTKTCAHKDTQMPAVPMSPRLTSPSQECPSAVMGLEPPNAPLLNHQCEYVCAPSHPTQRLCQLLRDEGSQGHAERCWSHTLMCVLVCEGGVSRQLRFRLQPEKDWN